MRRTILLTLVIFATTSLSLQAAQITIAIPVNAAGGLYNSGVDASGTPLADGATDSHYLASGSAAELALTSAGGFPIPPWLGDDSSSDWISPAGHGNEASGIIDNVTTFTSPILGKLTITGQWSTDNEAIGIDLNGVSTGNANNNEFVTFTPFTITGLINPGVNTLDFLNQNDGGPGGVRVEFFSASVTTVPEPSTLAAFAGLGAIGLIMAIRRRPKAPATR